jgi:NADH-quinone oxidoreductase subunit N
MLAAVMLADTISPSILMYYVLVYSVSSIVTFATLYHISKAQNGAEGFDAFKGLVKRNPILAGAMTLALLSMAGIPPLSGFMAKYFIIGAVIQADQIWLAVIMILSSAIGIYYYLKIIMAMFTPIENAGRIVITDLQRILFIILSIAMVALFFVAAFVK